ncbi:MAG: phosphoenolpyruvate--protein phosphotransferase [Mariprofundales bacterium]|nr:phosphoenolpyruvate--protein phosphotransferase [Mariprofundales bacterium]
MNQPERRQVLRQHGTAASASSGVAIGQVQRLSSLMPHVPHHHISNSMVELELDRFRHARQAAITRAQKELESLARMEDSNPALLIKAHLMLLNDPNFINAIIVHIRDGLHNCGWSIQLGVSSMLGKFNTTEDTYLHEMRNQIMHAGHRITSHLTETDTSPLDSNHDTIILADDIPLPEVVRYWQRGAAGLITFQGGANSHMIVMSRGIGIPALAGIEQTTLHHARDGDTIILDAERQRWILNPNPEDIAHYQRFTSAMQQANAELQNFANQASVTLDGVVVELLCNVEFPQELEQVLRSGVNGIGLLRTEFLFLTADHQPDEEEQFQFYRPFVNAMGDRPTTIRLLDIGADKSLAFDLLKNNNYSGENPALGMRGIRLLLHAPELLRAQIRALLRLSEHGSIKILVPMITHRDQMEQVRTIIRNEAMDLGIAADTVPLGAMIEVPAAAIIADELAEVSDFFSIGSNDLIQYTLAADRCDENVFGCRRDIAAHPAILQLISMAAASAHAADIPISLCGELAADPAWIKPLIQAGITTFSMHCNKILPQRRHIRHLMVGNQNSSAATSG